MLQRTVHLSAITAITPLLSVAILISAVHFNVAQAQKAELAAKSYKNTAPVYQCLETTCSRASERTRTSFPKDVLDLRTILCAVVTETQHRFARASSRV